MKAQREAGFWFRYRDEGEWDRLYNGWELDGRRHFLDDQWADRERQAWFKALKLCRG